MIKQKITLPILIMIVVASTALGIMLGIVAKGRSSMIEIHDSPAMQPAAQIKVIDDGGP